MGARSYCRKCDAPMPQSSFRDIEDGFQMCVHCNAMNKLNRTLADALEELDARLTALEARPQLVPESDLGDTPFPMNAYLCNMEELKAFVQRMTKKESDDA